MALLPMTIAIASYQRRDPLLRLLHALDDQVAADPSLGRDLGIVVVLDGSTDGSREAVEGGTWRVPVTVRWQPNRGLAAARNVGLDSAGDGLIWLLDDDLIPSDGLLRRHRDAHAPAGDAIVVGRCSIPDDIEVPAPLRRWWVDFHAQLQSSPTIDRFDLFTAANTSGPARLFTRVGGFDERFVGYGLEDYELAHRLLAGGTTIRYDHDAVAWHPDVPPLSTLVHRQRSLGRNAATIALVHPELAEDLFPLREPSPPRRVIRALRLRSPRLLVALSRAALVLHHATGRLPGETARRAEWLARAAAHAAGVAEVDRSGVLLARVIGYPARPRRALRRSARQPTTSPTSSQSTISR